MNTIYDNTFVLGQTSATNFVAGPGISITQPSEGTVRIANDETVLWSGASTNTAFNLSEPITNFEYIMLSNDVLPAPAVVVKVEPSHSAKFGYARSWMSDDNTCHYRFYSVTSTDGKNFVNRYTRGIDYTTAMAETHGGGSDWHLENTMIIGINRKEVL